MIGKVKSLIVILFFLLTSCGPYWYKPYGRIFTHMPEGGTPGFNLGWKHGCYSGLGTQFGNAFYMTFYTWVKDTDISSSNPDFEKIRKRYKKELKDVDWNNPDEVKKNLSDYNIIFWAAHSYCRHSTLQNQQMAGFEPPLPGGERHKWSDWSVGSVYDINHKGDARLSYW